MLPSISIFGLVIPTYFLVLSLVFSALVPFVLHRAREKKLDQTRALDLYLFIMLGSFLGARLFFIVYQDLSFYLQNPLEIFYFWKGGFVYFGGFIGAVVAGYVFLKKKNEPIRDWLNLVAPVASLGYAVGRLGCFLNGCCYGKATTFFLGIEMHSAHRHPTQLYASLFEFIVFGLLLLIDKKRIGFLRPENLFFYWLIGHGLGRILMELLRDDDRGSAILGLSVSTCISLVLISVGFLFLFKNINKTSPKH